jgi:hypothetical protein
MENPNPRKKPLQQLEIVCAMVAAMPGLLRFTGGPVQNSTQATFRISLFVIGLCGYIAVKIYQHKKAR